MGIAIEFYIKDSRRQVKQNRNKGINYHNSSFFHSFECQQKLTHTLSVEPESQISFVFRVDELKTRISLAVCSCSEI